MPAEEMQRVGIFFVAGSAGEGTDFLNYSSGPQGRGLVGSTLVGGLRTVASWIGGLMDGGTP